MFDTSEPIYGVEAKDVNRNESVHEKVKELTVTGKAAEVAVSTAIP